MLTDLLLNLEKTLSSSPILGLGASYLAGVLSSFSPCIYPLIPITLGIVGASSVSSRRRGFLLSLIFVLGIALSYTLLGIFASVMGIFLGRIFINPITYAVLSVILLLLGLTFFDIIKIKLFSFSPEQKHDGSLLSLFMIGAISAFAIAPCIFPVLGAILSMIALKQNIIYGAIALFLFSLGYGTTLIIIGTFTSLLRKLPKSGLWLIIIKRVLGGVLIVMAGYFLFRCISLLI
ncbi:MAG: hypothetical protein GY858_08140 [Candidatus Omnitrophica bacterium]|nr:hypothetical protein [Candidatus Omnitrophota bacterium]